MIQTVNFNQFSDSFDGSCKDNFTYEGKRALFDYLEQYEEESDEKLELDPVAFCCEFTEYKNFRELKSNYPDIKNMDDLNDHTIVIPIEGTDRFIIQSF